MCESGEYLSISWKWNPDLPSIHIYCKMLWENKYKEDYERICNGLFSLICKIFFGEEAQCLSLEGQKTLQNYGYWYITFDGVYIKMSGITKALHWLPHFVPNTLLLQDIPYQTYVNGGVV